MTEQKLFDETEVNTAICIWEELLTFRGVEKSDAPDWQKCIANMFARNGTAAMRDICTSLVRPIDKIWADMEKANEEDDAWEAMSPFDWEFVPFVLSQMDWTGGYPAIPKDIQARLRDEIVVRVARMLVTR